ncbi:DNA polymerase III subunit delta [Corynebacterium mastitidis]|uniref:DNA polymerase III subunit delta n=1 Tax=Corynebacterium mastitidis TaxID=161890 RepID=UPI0025515F1A|nr:DNA polymerase III subunit delta [Corynebacterium mastitidis]MDK8449407.1 DNA polymerase III subunit delta [Corynebacterium mastitidis]
MDSQVHLIVGTEAFLVERQRRAIIEQIKDGRPEVTVTPMNAGELTASEVLEVLSPSLFGDDRVVVVKNTEVAGKEPAELLVQAARDPGPGIYLIVEHSGGGRTKALVPKLEKLATAHRADEVKQRELPGWVTQEFRSHGVRITPDVVHALLEGVGSDLRELASAVAQLVADAQGDITVATVRAYYSGVAEVSAFDIADWAVTGQAARAVAATRRALQLGMSSVVIAAALSSKVGMIARLYSTSGRVDSRRLAGQLGAHPFVIEKTSKVARRWSSDSVSRAVILMAYLDATVKGQGGDPLFAIESAVQRVARLAG